MAPRANNNVSVLPENYCCYTQDEILPMPESKKYRVGALCAGYGGIELGLEKLLKTETIWVSDFEAVPSKILEKRFISRSVFTYYLLNFWRFKIKFGIFFHKKIHILN